MWTTKNVAGKNWFEFSRKKTKNTCWNLDPPVTTTTQALPVTKIDQGRKTWFLIAWGIYLSTTITNSDHLSMTTWSIFRLRNPKALD